MNIELIAKMAGVDVSEAEEFINADWPNADEHAEWIATATDEEIADWIVAGK